MASHSLSGFSSAFDDLLHKNRGELQNQLDSAFRRTTGAEGQTAPAERAGSDAAAPPARPSPLSREGEYHTASQVWDAARSETARILDARHGDGWEFTVVKRQREGDEYIVMGKLSLPERGVSKSQFGRGTIPREPAGSAAGTMGSAGGVSFSSGGGAGGGHGQSPEQRGYRRAIEDALAKCAALL